MEQRRGYPLIKIGDERFPSYVTIGAALRFEAETGKKIAELATDSDITTLVTYIWCCVASACNVENIPFLYDLQDFADHLDNDALAAWSAAMQGAAAAEEDGGKKN